MKRKAPTDKELRLYARLSDVDGDLILESILPGKQGASLSADSRPSLWAALRRPRYALPALCALALLLTASILLMREGNRGPAVTPFPHGSGPALSGEATDPSDPVNAARPTAENAASLRKGMGLSDVIALMGRDYTQDGTRYIFTLNTGEQLAVDTEYIYGGTVGSRVTGFEWLGDTAGDVNPLTIPSDILQDIQEYATDKVIPVYTVRSLIKLYDSAVLPTLDGILQDAELAYLRMDSDGKTVIVNSDGLIRGSFPQGGDFSLLTEVSALFDGSVQIEAYYPILTSMERGAVYFRTSIGDYILYLHGERLPLAPEGLVGTADAVPYLMPVSVFHQFAFGMVDKSAALGIGWDFTEERMAVIAPYKLDGEGYQKPSGVGTPEAAEQLRVGMTRDELIALMGPSLSTEAQSNLGIFYRKLTDGRGLFVYCRPDPWSASSADLRVTDIVWLESGDLLDTLGRPSCAVVSQLIRTNMSREAVVSLLGKAPGGTYVSSSASAPRLSTSSWTWEEDRETYTFTVHWLTTIDNVTGSETPQVREMTLTEALSPNEKPTPAMAEQVTVGMTDNAVLSQMSGIPSMTDFCGDGILYVWELSDGRYFGAVLENRAPEGVESYRVTVTHTFYRDTAEEIGQPTKANAECITPGMSYAAVVALVGEPDTVRKRDDGSFWSTVHWLTDRNLLSVEIEWLVVVNTKTGAIYHTVHEAVIAVG